MNFLLHNAAIDQIHALAHFWQVLTPLLLGLCKAYIGILLFLVLCSDPPQSKPFPLIRPSAKSAAQPDLEPDEPDEPDISWHFEAYEINTHSLF